MEKICIEGVWKSVSERLIVSEMDEVIAGWRKGRNVVSKICKVHYYYWGDASATHIVTNFILVTNLIFCIHVK
jgi:hypothetical protein